MRGKIGFFWLFSVIFMFVIIRTSEAQISPLLIACGTNSSMTVDGRRWIGDLVADNLTLSSVGISATIAINTDSSYSNLYKTARVFTGNSNYTVRVSSPGNYYLRLHFYPISFQIYNVNDSIFDVMVNNVRLLSDLHVSDEISRRNLYSQSLGGNSTVISLVNEYFFNVDSTKFWIKFDPSPGSFAFVSAIEIIPVPDDLFEDSASKVASNGANTSLNMNNGMETMFRLNVGGPEVAPEQDGILRRRWESDLLYMITANAGHAIKNSSDITYGSGNVSLVAPLEVYETARIMANNEVLDKIFNMSWKFVVDPNFEYLVRLHFCELLFTKPNQRVFKIYINKKTAADNFDIWVRAGGENIAYHQDYVDSMSPKIDTFWIQLGPDISVGASGTDALLNGIEIFKLSRNGNLARIVEKSGSNGLEPSGKKSKNSIVWVAVGAAIALVVIISVLSTAIFCFCHRRRKSEPIKNQSVNWRPLFQFGAIGSTTDAKASRSPLNPIMSMATTRTGKRFTISEIKTATRNFDESLVIGVGGFGKVYKGEIENGEPVAIKRAHPQSEQGLKEFETEIEMLSKLRHRHLVSMIGYCEEQKEMILVYEYMANGTLRNHLFGSDLPALSWKQRLDVCIGAARGLHYLHTGAERGIIHRDVKTTNILLDENFVAKMADFGLSKTGPALDHTHVSTAVKGSFGYLDPEYFRRQQLTEKSDVYSFGVVLFEVVCARPVINPSLPREQVNLAEWAIRWQHKGQLQNIVDPQLAGTYSPQSLRKFGEIAEKCLADEGKNRPTMGEVLWHLEYVLQLQEAALCGDVSDSEEMDMEVGQIPEALDPIPESTADLDGENPLIGESEDTMGVADFSQLVHPQGR